MLSGNFFYGSFTRFHVFFGEFRLTWQPCEELDWLQKDPPSRRFGHLPNRLPDLLKLNEWFLFDLKHNKLDCLSIFFFALKRGVPYKLGTPKFIQIDI